jgi:hypothetical protein
VAGGGVFPGGVEHAFEIGDGGIDHSPLRHDDEARVLIAGNPGHREGLVERANGQRRQCVDGGDDARVQHVRAQLHAHVARQFGDIRVGIGHDARSEQ